MYIYSNSRLKNQFELKFDLNLNSTSTSSYEINNFYYIKNFFLL